MDQTLSDYLDLAGKAAGGVVAVLKGGNKTAAPVPGTPAAQAAAAPSTSPKWLPWAIGGGIVAALGLVVFLVTRKG